MRRLNATVHCTFALAALAVACDAAAPAEVPGQRAESALERERNPEIAAETQRHFAEDRRAFAVEMFQRASAESEGNVSLSPHSISSTLAMLYAGARGDTRAQMTEALGFELGDDLHRAFNDRDLRLSARAGEGDAAGGGPLRLRVVHELFGQRGHEFEQEFLDRLALHYGAAMNLLDFFDEPERARAEINEWIADVTEQRIPELFGEGAIRENAKLVLVNALYFNAAWSRPFDDGDTEERDFYAFGDTSVQVPTMTGTAPDKYTSGEGYEAVSLPYVAEDLHMVVIAPDRGTHERFGEELSAELLQRIFEDLESKNVELSLPRFSFSWGETLDELLKDMGMIDAFTENVADFSGVDGTRKLFVDKVVHEAFIEVTEEGTEAAAATGAVGEATSAPEPVRIDRPFFFVIRDIPTDTILFMGRVVDPR